MYKHRKSSSHLEGLPPPVNMNSRLYDGLAWGVGVKPSEGGGGGGGGGRGRPYDLED